MRCAWLPALHSDPDLCHHRTQVAAHRPVEVSGTPTRPDGPLCALGSPSLAPAGFVSFYQESRRLLGSRGLLTQERIPNGKDMPLSFRPQARSCPRPRPSCRLHTAVLRTRLGLLVLKGVAALPASMRVCSAPPHRNHISHLFLALAATGACVGLPGRVAKGYSLGLAQQNVCSQLWRPEA